MEMTRVLQEITSMVRSQKCMNPATWIFVDMYIVDISSYHTSRMVEATQKMTMQEARRLPRKTRTVRKMARRLGTNQR